MNIEHILAEAEGFDWDEGNINKNWIKHLVSPEEVEEVFYNKPLLLYPDDKHSGYEQRFVAMGKTDTGRLLFINWTSRNRKIRPISTRPMNNRERKLYEQTA
jgi:uncharacterized DUF497 family protein